MKESPPPWIELILLDEEDEEHHTLEHAVIS